MDSYPIMTCTSLNPKVATMDPYEILKIPSSVLNFFGHWPCHHRKQNLRIRGTLSNIINFAFCFIAFFEGLQAHEDFFASIQILTIFTEAFSYLVKDIFFKWSEEDFVSLYSFLDDDAFRTVPTNVQHYVQRSFRIVKRISIGYLVNCQLTIALTVSLPLYTGSVLPIKFTLFDIGRFWPLMYFFQTVGFLNAATNHASLDMLTIGFMTLIKGQCQILSGRIQHFRELATEETSSDDDVDDRESRQISFLQKCVDHHVKINRLVALVEKVFSILLLIQYLTSIMVICNIGFQLVIIESFSFSFLMMISFFLAMICQLGMYCWFGNEIIVHSSAIRDACYESDWINSSTKVRKMLLIIMERAKRPIHLTAGKFSILSLASFTSVINSAYSFFALMQSMYSKSEKN